ncbi:MAG: YbjQ family protein [Hyphomicrobium sp.]|nr:YbjQ family protein [Hyphomicrobium sp.]
MLVVTTNELEGYRIVRHLGLVRGLTVRSRSVVGNLGAAIQIFFGGNITVYTKLAEQTRQEAFNLLVAHAQEIGANAVIGMRYDANEIAAAVTEVLAYGTAVVVEPIDQQTAQQTAGASNPWSGTPPGLQR